MILTKGAYQRLSTAHVKFHQISILIGSFCWKYIKCQLIKYRRVMSHDTEGWCKIWRKIDLSFQNWHEKFDEFWSEHWKVSKICTLIGSFWPKYIMFELKKYRWVIFHDTEEWWKFEEKLTCGLENHMRNLVKFYQSTWRCQNWDFDGILLFKVENAWAKNFQRIYVYWNWRMIKTLNRNWIVVSKLAW